MARVPSWAELCTAVNELSTIQKECYDSVHNLLDPGLPELDCKIRYLMSKPELRAPECRRPSREPSIRPNIESIMKPSIEPKIKPSIKQSMKLSKKASKKEEPPKLEQKIQTPINDLKHLKAPKMPLSEYLKRNRPDIWMNVEARSAYIRKISEERKSQRAHRIMSSLERVCISTQSRKRNNYLKQTTNQRPPMRTMEDIAPDYCVRHKVSEREMKQLTLRNYRRLPEVKKQKLEQINKHLKEQYYRNRQLYGRMLRNNFKNGIINYPLRVAYDDRSITSSQSEYSMSQSADTACSSLDPYF